MQRIKDQIRQSFPTNHFSQSIPRIQSTMSNRGWNDGECKGNWSQNGCFSCELRSFIIRRQYTPGICIGFPLWLVLPSIFVGKSPVTPDSPYFRWTLNPDGRQELSMSLAEIKQRPASTQAILSRWGLRQPVMGRSCPRLGRTTFSKPYNWNNKVY